MSEGVTCAQSSYSFRGLLLYDLRQVYLSETTHTVTFISRVSSADTRNLANSLDADQVRKTVWA